MPLDIIDVQSLLFGISFLCDENTEQIKTLWQARFPKTEAFWLEAKEDTDTNALLESAFATMRENHCENLRNRTCVVCFFADFRKPLTERQTDVLHFFSQQLGKSLFCNIMMEQQFLFIGTNPLPNNCPAEEVKKRILELSKMNADQPFNTLPMLVARRNVELQDNSDCWKAAILYLDLLRRNQAINQVMAYAGHNLNDDISFLRYMECDLKSRRELKAEVKALENEVSTNGADAFRSYIERKTGELTDDAKEKHKLFAELQPIHPGMNPERGFARWRAKKGKNSSFNSAKNATRSALQETARRVKADIENEVLSTVNDWSDYLETIRKEAGLGLGVYAKKHQMCDIFKASVKEEKEPHLPQLSYNPEGYSEEIQKFFSSYTDYAAVCAGNSFCRKLQAAYNTVPDEKINEQHQRAENDLKDKNNRLAATPDTTQFVQLICDDSGTGMRTGFLPQTPGGQTKKIIIGHDPKLAEKYQDTIANKATSMLLPRDGLLENESSVLKGLHILSFDCTKERLDDLLQSL